MKKTYAGIDFFRLTAAFLVVGIHVGPLSAWNETADFLLTYCAGRVAVPFFLMTTGYFVLAPYGKSGFREKRGLRKYLIKNIRLYLVASILYAPLALYAGNRPRGLRDFFKKIFFDGTFYHLWYFPAAIMGCVLLAVLMRKFMRISADCTEMFCGSRYFAGEWHGILLAVVCAYIVGLLGDSYYGLAERFFPLRLIYRGIFLVSSYTRNGIFYAPVFLLLGMMTAFPKFCCPAGKCGAGFLISFAGMLLEGFFTYRLHWQRHNSMYLILPLVMYFLFQLLLALPGKAPGWLRPCSMIVYIVHPAVIVLLRGFAKITGLTGFLIQNTMVQYLAVCALSMALAAGILCGKKSFGMRR